MTKLTGEYQFSNSTQLKGVAHEITLLIGKRHKPSAGKPQAFILQVLPDGKRKYLSSLYPALDSSLIGLETYFLEWEGKRYQLDINKPEGRAIITSTEQSLKRSWQSTNS